MKPLPSLSNTAWFLSVAIALLFLLGALLCAPAHTAPLGIVAGTDFAAGRPDQMVGITYRPSPHGSIFAVANLAADNPWFNTRGMLRAKIARHIHALILLGGEVTFKPDADQTRDFSTKLSLSTGLGIAYQPIQRLSTWIAVDYQPATNAPKRARYALGIVVWLID